jgi:hypothetical protein
VSTAVLPSAIPLAQRNFFAWPEPNNTVDKRYQTKVKVIVRNITPKAAKFQHPDFSAVRATGHSAKHSG